MWRDFQYDSAHIPNYKYCLVFMLLLINLQLPYLHSSPFTFKVVFMWLCVCVYLYLCVWNLVKWIDRQAKNATGKEKAIWKWDRIRKCYEMILFPVATEQKCFHHTYLKNPNSCIDSKDFKKYYVKLHITIFSQYDVFVELYKSVMICRLNFYNLHVLMILNGIYLT